MKLFSTINTNATKLSQVMRKFRSSRYGRGFEITGFRLKRDVTFDTWITKTPLKGGEFPGNDRDIYTRKRVIAGEKGNAFLVVLPSDKGGLKKSKTAFFYDPAEDAWGHVSDSHLDKLKSASEIARTKIEDMFEKREVEKRSALDDIKDKVRSEKDKINKKFLTPVFSKLKHFQVGEAFPGEIPPIETTRSGDGVPHASFHIRQDSFGFSQDRELEYSASVSSGTISTEAEIKKTQEIQDEIALLIKACIKMKPEYEKLRKNTLIPLREQALEISQR